MFLYKFKHINSCDTFLSFYHLTFISRANFYQIMNGYNFFIDFPKRLGLITFLPDCIKIYFIRLDNPCYVGTRLQ